MKEDKQPRNHATIQDILTWIEEEKEIEEKYHLSDSNCQHFTSNLWSRFASSSYPNPAKYEAFVFERSVSIAQ